VTQLGGENIKVWAAHTATAAELNAVAAADLIAHYAALLALLGKRPRETAGPAVAVAAVAAMMATAAAAATAATRRLAP
jgi:hypothetical protein